MSLEEKLKQLSSEDREALKQAFSHIEPEALEDDSREAEKLFENLLPSKELGEQETSDLVGAILKGIDAPGLYKSLEAMATQIKSLVDQNEALAAKLSEMETKLTEKQKSVDEMIAEQLTPEWGDVLNKMFNDDPAGDEEIIEQMKENVPSVTKANPDNPLTAMLWNPVMLAGAN